MPATTSPITAGILLGPTVLGRLFPGLPGRLFPPEVPLRQLADLGLVFFMFLVGLELDTRLMQKEGRRALQISLSGVLAPFVLGMAIAVPLLGVNNAGRFATNEAGEALGPPGLLPFALFMGAAMCITAFPILARILVETGLYKTGVGTAALCAAAVDDAIAWILLAGVVGITRTGSPAEAGVAFVLTAIFVAFMFTAGRRLLGLLARRYDETGRLSVDQVAVVIAGVLLAAFATERIGIHAIFGAFVFGAIMPKRSGMTHELTDKIEDFTVIVLLPVFFTVTGLRTDLFTLNSPALLGWVLTIVAVATLGKFAGCGLAARLTGSSTRDAVVVGALMNTRGLTELVILSIGLGLGVLSDRTFAMMVIMALATTFMAAPVVNRLISRDETVRDLVGATPAATPAAARILVALGNPANAGALVDVAIRLTGARRPAELLLVRLIPTPRASEFRSGLREEESQVAASVESMRRLVEGAAAAGVTARPISFLSDDVGADLARVAADQGCDAILLGWHRASLERHVVRALAHRTFALAPCDVAVFVDRRGRGVLAEADRPTLVALTGGEGDEAAVRLGTRLAENLGTGAKLVGFLGAAGRAASATTDSEELALRRSSGQWATPVFVAGDATGAAVEESEGGAVAVVGVGADWAGHEDFGAPASALAAAAECPVLVVRAGAVATREAAAVEGVASSR
jgi:Kef-type K+ transport system membrane component KefB/nucleotide-binding universal stress UspA family protein